jgi:hypothetical protein
MPVQHVVVGSSKIGGRFLNRNWPITDGIIAGSTTQEGHRESLEAIKSYTEDRLTKGIT